VDGSLHKNVKTVTISEELIVILSVRVDIHWTESYMTFNHLTAILEQTNLRVYDLNMLVYWFNYIILY
jgi:hypothetical protein